MKGTYSELNKTREKIDNWQNGDFHPLTCGNDSRHSLLKTNLNKDGDEFELSLFCEDCDWKQDVPKLFTSEVIEDDAF